jgi:hypothetical protein
MKLNTRNMIFMIMLALLAATFNSCSPSPVNKWGGGQPFAIPISVSGVILEQTGNQIKTAGVPVKVMDSLGHLFTAATGGGPKFSYTRTLEQAKGTCLLSSSFNGFTFLSWIDGFDPENDTVDVVYNTAQANTAPMMELVFLNHDGTPVTQALSVKLMQGAAQVGTGMISNGATGLFSFPNLLPATKYTFTCANSSGQVSDAYGRPISRSFTTPAGMPAKTVVGYTFFLK